MQNLYDLNRMEGRQNIIYNKVNKHSNRRDAGSEPVYALTVHMGLQESIRSHCAAG
ncbi:hypothetical protein M408DRAFT_93679 [Serendipita vermifera MAFF 305830]|uniref:Uncharacterized protein n=1 Tax=Serendipita vermifera MAFF 305830 TaxID=933852 RepID=A0A0C3BSD0_SERVB|nr:hypothetical protein M408DRAFT_93679 [Serendipita vermifera MAFF 305830]